MIAGKLEKRPVYNNPLPIPIKSTPNRKFENKENKVNRSPATVVKEHNRKQDEGKTSSGSRGGEKQLKRRTSQKVIERFSKVITNWSY